MFELSSIKKILDTCIQKNGSKSIFVLADLREYNYSLQSWEIIKAAEAILCWEDKGFGGKFAVWHDGEFPFNPRQDWETSFADGEKFAISDFIFWHPQDEEDLERIFEM